MAIEVRINVEFAKGLTNQHRVVTLDNERQSLKQKSCLTNITAAVNRRPNSPRKSSADGANGPRVSSAIGWKRRLCALASFREAASYLDPPGSLN